MGAQLLWFLGDNFMAKSICTHFKNKDGDFFIKKRFDFNAYCNSKFSSPMENMLVHLQNALVCGLNVHRGKDKDKNGFELANSHVASLTMW